MSNKLQTQFDSKSTPFHGRRHHFTRRVCDAESYYVTFSWTKRLPEFLHSIGIIEFAPIVFNILDGNT